MASSNFSPNIHDTYHLTDHLLTYFASLYSGLENSTRPLVFTSASGCKASENFDISSENYFFPIYSKTGLKRSLKIDSKVLMKNGSLMKVESIAECSPWSILQGEHSAIILTCISDNRY